MNPLPARLFDVSKRISSTFAIAGLCLEIEAGEFFCLLGPSGSGKSTLLGLIGGWVLPDRGTIMLGTDDYTLTPPFQRPIRTCFQKGGFLFPHMTVRQNIGYALKLKGFSRRSIELRVTELTAQVGLKGLEGRKPSDLSGGEAQRVAIARALADPQPILLLDEIQTGLDRHLRASIRDLLVDVTLGLRVTTIYVTHDASEALGLASRLNSRLGVLNNGQIVQVGSATEVYRAPRTSFIASFLGDINLLAIKQQNSSTLITNGGNVFRSEKCKGILVKYVGIRPEAITFERNGDKLIELHGKVEGTEFLGPIVRVALRVNEDLIIIQISGVSGLPDVGRNATCYVAERDLILLEE